MQVQGQRMVRFIAAAVTLSVFTNQTTEVLGVPPGDADEAYRYISVATETSVRQSDGTSPKNVNLPQPQDFGVPTGGDNCNDATSTLLSVPGSATVFGDSTGVTGPDACAFNFTIWWEAFEITECADVTLDFCGTSPVLPSNFVFVASQCAADGTCSGNIDRNSNDRTTCADGNITMVFKGLPAGTYYYPIISNSPGPYQMNITTATCVGACCDTLAGTCMDNVPVANCIGASEIFSGSSTCCELECRDPAGPQFDSSGVTLLSRVTFDEFATFNGTPGNPHTGNEVWGYTSPSGREYAIMGTTTGTGFVDITVPTSPVILAFIDNGGVDTVWRDMAVANGFAYVVTDGVGVGLQIIDLRNIDAGTVTFVKSTDLGLAFSEAHNVHINPDSGFMYLAIPDLNSGNGITAVSLADPLNPVVAGTWTDTAAGVRCHDVHVVSYTSGPNAGREIAFCFAENDGLKIADVTNKAAMFTVATLAYPTRDYCHQGWVSSDGQYVFFGDELDELDGLVSQTTTFVADVSNLSAPTLASTFEFSGCNIDHNMMVRGEFLYEANYATGLRVLRFGTPPFLTEFAHFDTHPENNGTNFEGAWGVFTDFPSGVVLLSDRQRGLFVFENPETPPPPPPPPAGIPTVSTWGLAGLVLVLLAAGTIAISRRDRVLRA